MFLSPRFCQLFGIAALLAGGSAVQAAPFSTTSIRHNINNANNHHVIRELQAAKQLLEKADHDYAGHRARAVHEISMAIHEIQHHGKAAHHRPAAPTAHTHARGKPANGGNKLKEPQAVSDAQLRQAGQILATALTQLPTNHPKARANIQAAIGELQTALKIK